MSEPLVRARFVQDWLSRLADEPDPWRSRFFIALDRRDPGARHAIRRAPGVGWVDFRYHVLLADVMAETLGLQRSHEFYRRGFVASLSTPILGPLIKSGTRLFGFTPALFCRWYAHGWQVCTRDAGQAAGELVGPARGAITYTALPSVCARSDAWLNSAVGSAYGVLDAMGLTGLVRQDLSRRGEGIMRLDVEWSPRAASGARR
jgi:hypothetical protein